MALDALSAWRFVPGLLGAPGRLWPRVRARLRPPAGSAGAVRDLFAAGAAEFLAWDTLRLAPLLDRAATEAFLADARAGRASLPVAGRMLALEAAYRAASSPMS